MSSRIFEKPGTNSAGKRGVVRQAGFDGGEPDRAGALALDTVVRLCPASRRSCISSWPVGRSWGGLMSAWYTSRAAKRLRQRMISLGFFPSAVRRAT